jgi:hypothetical protein
MNVGGIVVSESCCTAHGKRVDKKEEKKIEIKGALQYMRRLWLAYPLSQCKWKIVKWYVEWIMTMINIAFWALLQLQALYVLGVRVGAAELEVESKRMSSLLSLLLASPLINGAYWAAMRRK